MTTARENSFGARLRRAQDLAAFTAGFKDFAPPRYEESNAGFQALINQLVAANEQETSYLNSYNAAVTRRYHTFHDDPKSLTKRLALIRANVIALFGKSSIEFSQTNKIITLMRIRKTSVKPATDTTSEVKHSTSQQSYGSVTQHFTNLITTLQSFKDYIAPLDLKLTQLIAFKDNLTVLNDEVANQFFHIKEIKEKRRNLYQDLLERATRIKALVKATYGTQSPEYLLIRGLKF